MNYKKSVTNKKNLIPIAKILIVEGNMSRQKNLDQIMLRDKVGQPPENGKSESEVMQRTRELGLKSAV